MTSLSPSEVERIARGLTEAQRAMLMSAVQDGELGRFFIRFPEATIGKSLHNLGLTTLVWSGLMLNKLGEQVRAFLQADSRRKDEG